MSRHVIAFCSFALLAAGLIPTSVAVAAGSRPNIIFVFADDHAYQAISAYGSRVNKTPNIDRLAREGMKFNHCYVTNSICGPMRAVIQTGKYSHINGFCRNGNKFDGTQWTFPKALQTAGYQTAVIGKWHLGEHMAPQGYDYSEVLIGQGPYYNPPMLSDSDGDGERERVNHTGYTTHIITDLALGWLKEKRDPNKPFMLMYQHKAPHREWCPGPKYLNMYDDVTMWEPPTLFDDYSGRGTPAKIQDMTIAKTMNDRDLKLVTPRNLTPEQMEEWNAAYEPKNEAFRKANLTGDALVRWKYQRYIKDYLRCIAAVDDNLGRLLEYLDESDLSDNTVIMYCSDQGFYLGEHGWFDKRWMYEESLRTPFLVRWPGVIESGSVNEDIVSPVDFAATFCELAGAQGPEDLQGRSLVPVFKSKTPADWRTSLYYHYYEGGGHGVKRHYGVADRRHKLIHFYEDDIDEWEMYDLAKDPMELQSVYDVPEYAGVQKRLHAELKRLRRELNVPEQDPPESFGGWGDKSKLMSKRILAKAAKTKLEQVLQLEEPGPVADTRPDVAEKPFTVGARITPDSGDGVIIAQGGGSHGFTLYLKGGVPHFAIRAGGNLRQAVGDQPLALGKPAHVAGMLDAKGKVVLYVNGGRVARVAGLFIPSVPSDGLSIGQDSGSAVGEYETTMPFQGRLNDIRMYFGTLDNKAIREMTGTL